ncbi:outer membrane beta-barrel protein [Vulgatibacter sp.]|uniref:outer membrane beta-barrel protein n=1 Tax=Vulgatibacter sp. TaxID=1971226 RepID=UPI00356967BD
MRKYLLVVAAALVALPTAASAVKISKSERASEGAPELLGIPVESLSAGIGYSNYTGEIAPDIAPGPGWDLRLDLDVTQPVELEVQYMGAVNSVIPDPLSEFNLYTNQFQTAAQVAPWTVGDVEPYVSGGIGLTRVSVAKNPDLNAQIQSDTMGSVPLAAGADYPITDALKIGARAQWDIYFDNELLVQENTTDSDRWGFMVNIGATEF